jgi:hypothetical protein
MEEEFHVFLTSVLDEAGCPGSILFIVVPFPPGKEFLI